MIGALFIHPNGREISYTYDKNNNITSIQEGSKTVSYFYGGLNQLIRENNGFIGTAGKTITYSYDAGGNILSKTEYPLTTGDNFPTAVKTYEYKYDKVADGGKGWNDKLVKIIITENGTPTTYDLTCDSIGNLTKYNGYTYTWEGRQLRGITGTDKNISFKYDSSGVRTEKDVDGNVTKYHLVGDEVTYEETEDSSGNVINKIYYMYSSSGKLVAMVLNGVQYNYIRNAQGDIIGLLDSTGAEVVSYTYDSWGKLESISGTKASTIGAVNPYRYRGCRYDSETGLYYLQSRYYNPEWGRFINADEIAAVTGELLSGNMFAYCENNAINMQDSNGFRRVSIYDDDQEFEGYTETARDRARANDPMRSSDAKKKEKQDIDHALGKRGSKEREQKSQDLHKTKKKSGDKNYNNRDYGDLVDGNYEKSNLSPAARVGIFGTGAVIIVGTIVEDVFTGGVGILDDGVTIAGGGGLIMKAFGY